MHQDLNDHFQDFPALQKVVVERPVFPKAVIQNRNQSILILASAERRVSAKPDVEWQVFERGKCPGNGHSRSWFWAATSDLISVIRKRLKNGDFVLETAIRNHDQTGHLNNDF